jgi:hypothetical protein
LDSVVAVELGAAETFSVIPLISFACRYQKENLLCTGKGEPKFTTSRLTQLICHGGGTSGYLVVDLIGEYSDVILEVFITTKGVPDSRGSGSASSSSRSRGSVLTQITPS